MLRAQSVIFLFSLSLLYACSKNPLPTPGKIPPGVHFEGVWDSNWGQMTLREKGNKIYGVYRGFRNGSISGTLNGNLMQFRWTQEESRQWGRGYLQLSPDGQRLEGRWGYLKNAYGGGKWWANRAP